MADPQYDVLWQGEHGTYRAVLKDPNGNPIQAAQLSYLRLTFRDQKTLQIINSRNSQEVLNLNNVTLNASGNLTWTLQPNDNVILATDLKPGDIETHIAHFEWLITSTGAIGMHEDPIYVRKTTAPPASGPIALGDHVFSGDIKAPNVITTKTPFTDVRAYGVSTSSSDNSTNLQTAIDNAKGPLLFPDGDFQFASPLILRQSLVAFGVGVGYAAGKTRLIYTGSDWAFKVDNSGASIGDIFLAGFSLVGNANALGGIKLGDSKAGFSIDRCKLARLLIVGFAKAGSIGLRLEGVTHSKFSDIFIDQIAGINLDLLASNSVQPGPLLFDNLIIGSGSTPLAQTGIQITPSNASIHSVMFNAALISSQVLYGVHFKPGTGGQRSSNFLFNACSFELNANDNATIVRIEELFGAKFLQCNYTTGNKANCKGFHFVKDGTKTIENVLIDGGHAASFVASSPFISVDQTGAMSLFNGNRYGNVELVSVANEISDSGFLLERTAKQRAGLTLLNLTTAQRDGIVSPTAGMTIFNTSLGQFQGYNGTTWITL